MKKSIKAGLCAGLLAVPLFVTAGGAFATGLGSDSKPATVGEVGETIYSVDILWGDMVFDWTYWDAPGTYNFKPRMSCEKYTLGSSQLESRMIYFASDWERLYSDSACTERVTDLGAGALPNGDPRYANGTEFYVKEVNSSIIVHDHSQNGRVKAQVSFTATDDYSWVSAHFIEHCTENSLPYGYCQRPDMGSLQGNELENGYLYTAGFAYYDLLHGYLILLGDDSDRTNVIEPGQTIGNITITVSANGD